MKKSRCLGLAALAWACLQGPALRAVEGEGPAPFRFGVRLLVSWPRQDFKDIDGRTGLGAGVFAENDLGNGTVLLSRLDYLRYPQAGTPGAAGIADYTVPDPLTLSTDSVSVGVDLRQRLPWPGLEGCFLLAGVTAARFEFETSTAEEVDGETVIVRTKDKTPFRVGFAAGLGWSFGRNADVTLRYTAVNTGGATFATLETGFGWRF